MTIIPSGILVTWLIKKNRADLLTGFDVDYETYEHFLTEAKRHHHDPDYQRAEAAYNTLLHPGHAKEHVRPEAPRVMVEFSIDWFTWVWRLVVALMLLWMCVRPVHGQIIIEGWNNGTKLATVPAGPFRIECLAPNSVCTWNNSTKKFSINGVQGPKGDTGATGAKGDTGASGASGTNADFIGGGFISLAATVVSGATTYTPLIGSGLSTSATENFRVQTFPRAVTITGLQANWPTGNTQSGTGSLVITLRKNQVDQTCALTIAAGTGGPGIATSGACSVSGTATDQWSLGWKNNASVTSMAISSLTFTYR